MGLLLELQRNTPLEYSFPLFFFESGGSTGERLSDRYIIFSLRDSDAGRPSTARPSQVLKKFAQRPLQNSSGFWLTPCSWSFVCSFVSSCWE